MSKTTTKTLSQDTSIKKEAWKRLTRKQKAFVGEIAKNPKISAAEAARRSTNVSTPSSATSRAHELMTNRDIQTVLGNLGEEAIQTIAEIMRTGQEGNRLVASRDLADRTFGKAVQRNTSVGLNFTASLDQDAIGI